MSVIDSLITDRARSDVGRNAKGSYNASDMNRVAEACAYLYGRFTAYGYAVPGYTAQRQDWTDADVPAASELGAYLRSVAALKSVLQAAQEIPETMSGLTVTGANNIEKLLIEVEDQIQRMERSFVYSGMVYSGQLWG